MDGAVRFEMEGDFDGSSAASLADFEDVELLASGNFGKVFLVRSQVTGRHYACKSLDKAAIVHLNQVEHVKSEKALLSSLTSPFIVKLHNSFQTATRLFLLLDYVGGGDLFFLLRRTQCFPERIAKFYAVEVLCGLEYLHSLCVLYRDLKPENCLITETGHLKLCDFGFATQLASPTGRTYTLCGTPEYAAPETVTRLGQSFPVDYWALGVLIFEMLTGNAPFRGASPYDTYNAILRGEPVYPPSMSKTARELCMSLLERDEANRLGSGAHGIADIKAHAWFARINWTQAARLEGMKVPWVPTMRTAGDATQFRRARKVDLSTGSARPAPLISSPSPAKVPMMSPTSRANIENSPRSHTGSYGGLFYGF
jgi:serine/threonine protein kinase